MVRPSREGARQVSLAPFTFMHDLVIQIVNYKTKKYLADCLKSVLEDLKDTALNYQINALDNDSGDDLSDLEKEYAKTGKVNFYQSEKNVGFGAGHNLLAKKAQAKYLLLLNPDVKIIEPNTIKRLISGIQRFNAQVIGPRLITAKRRTQWWDHGELHGLRARLFLNIGMSYWEPRKVPLEVAWVSGAVFLIEKSWFDKLDGFDENFFLRVEEEDLCWRLREEDGKVIYEPTITALHYRGVAGGNRRYHQRTSGAYFIDKHYRNRFGYRVFKFLNNLIRQ